MKRTKNLQTRTKLSKWRQSLRIKLDSIEIEAELLKNQVFLPAEVRQQVADRLKQIEIDRERLKVELAETTRGSHAQIAAGWH